MSDLEAAIKLQEKAAADLAQLLVETVEAICRGVESTGVMPIISLTTEPEGVYGGYPRRVKASVGVTFRRVGKGYDPLKRSSV